MDENTDQINITSWDTYKILNRIKETVQQKRKIANEVLVPLSINQIIWFDSTTTSKSNH